MLDHKKKEPFQFDIERDLLDYDDKNKDDKYFKALTNDIQTKIVSLRTTMQHGIKDKEEFSKYETLLKGYASYDAVIDRIAKKARQGKKASGGR